MFDRRFIGFVKLIVVPALAGRQQHRFRLKAVLKQLPQKFTASTRSLAYASGYDLNRNVAVAVHNESPITVRPNIVVVIEKALA